MSDVVNSMLTDAYTVSRRSPSAYVDGRLQPSTDSILVIDASVQPLVGPADLQRLPEGMRTDEARVIFTTTELFTQGPGQDPDIISIEGFAYEVHTVEAWGNVGNYYRAIASKMGH